MLPRCTKDVAITGFHSVAGATGTVQSAVSHRLPIALRCELLEGISHVGSHLGALDVVAHGDAGIVAEHARCRLRVSHKGSYGPAERVGGDPFQAGAGERELERLPGRCRVTDGAL